MTLRVTQSFDNAGEAKTSLALTSYGGAIRDTVVQFNRLVLFQANRTYENPVFAIDTNFDIKNTEPVTYFVSGVAKALADNANFDTGTAATITANLWGILILTHNGTTATVGWATTAAAMGYASEAAAIAALGTFSATGTAILQPAAGFASLGYVTVQAGASLWTAGTDALTTGTGGTVAATTNYYNDPSLNGTFGPAQIGDMNGVAITT